MHADAPAVTGTPFNNGMRSCVVAHDVQRRQECAYRCHLPRCKRCTHPIILRYNVEVRDRMASRSMTTWLAFRENTQVLRHHRNGLQKESYLLTGRGRDTPGHTHVFGLRDSAMNEAYIVHTTNFSYHGSIPHLQPAVVSNHMKPALINVRRSFAIC